MPNSALKSISEAPIRLYPSPIGLEIDCESEIRFMPFSAQQLRISTERFKKQNGFVKLTDNMEYLCFKRVCVFGNRCPTFS
jgi:hypothetical protein